MRGKQQHRWDEWKAESLHLSVVLLLVADNLVVTLSREERGWHTWVQICRNTQIKDGQLRICRKTSKLSQYNETLLKYSLNHGCESGPKDPIQLPGWICKEWELQRRQHHFWNLCCNLNVEAFTCMLLRRDKTVTISQGGGESCEFESVLTHHARVSWLERRPCI